MRLISSVLALSAYLTAPAFAGDLDFITGHWRSEPGRQVTEEIWTDGTGHLFLGVNRTLVDGEARAFEYMRIAWNEDGEGEYCAQPNGGEATCFRLVETGESHVVFENAGHDFPQRIRYAREDETLTATISDMTGEQSFSFVWTLVTD
ncbi:MAG: hypothetical protein CMF74_17375 [Maricaulis sp.]|jgi:hypothetical protein|nr:hypothetical protein [Maricaulis sp.]MAL11418.1 hypothetical protein [Maricaulis sp.]HAQ34891.1 hypothetical protein [Alphaproteobacteria bacterium]|tara:strand:- start:512 stop:955 length:444 start_codon:yes stop_codon:yes gene_type:complete